MAKVLNFDVWQNTPTHNIPFKWAYFENAFQNKKLAQELQVTFPHEKFERYVDYKRRAMERRGKKLDSLQLDKQEQNVLIRSLVELGSDKASDISDLSDLWRDLIDDVLSPDYREILTRLSGIDVRDLAMKVELWRHEGGAQLTPHTDRPNKVLTHLFYFNDDWRPEFGGCFRVLNSNNHDDCYQEIPPLLNTSLFLVRSDNSWHSVSAVPETCSMIRKVLQIWFWG